MLLRLSSGTPAAVKQDSAIVSAPSTVRGRTTLTTIEITLLFEAESLQPAGVVDLEILRAPVSEF